MAADKPDSDFEVIVADNGSSDDTVEIARSFMSRLPLRVIDAGARASSNYARNRGVLAASHPNILLVDGDDCVDPGWLTAMARAFAEGHELVAGPIDYIRLNKAETRAWRGADRASVATMLEFLPMAHGANLGFTRDLYDRLGGFDDDFEFGGPDVEFCWRAQLSGARLHEIPDAVVHYRLRPSLRTLFKQSRAYGAAEAHLYKKFRPHGLRRRRLSALAHDVWWIATRAPFARSPERRGAWIRRSGRQIGRFEGARKYRVAWW